MARALTWLDSNTKSERSVVAAGTSAANSPERIESSMVSSADRALGSRDVKLQFKATKSLAVQQELGFRIAPYWQAVPAACPCLVAQPRRGVLR